MASTQNGSNSFKEETIVGEEEEEVCFEGEAVAFVDDAFEKLEGVEEEGEGERFSDRRGETAATGLPSDFNLFKAIFPAISEVM